MKTIKSIVVILLLLMALSGCAQSAPTADGYDELGGVWVVSAVYVKNQFVNIHEYPMLEDLYDTTILTFNEDGTCRYFNIFISDMKCRRYNPDSAGHDSFLLDKERTYRLDVQDGEVTEKQVNSEPENAKYLVTLLDKNTLRLDTFDPVSGKAAASSKPILFVRYDE